MGDNADNAYVHCHAQDGWGVSDVEVWLTHHHGAHGIHSDSPKTGRATWKPLRDAILNLEPDSVVHPLGRAAFTAAWWNAHIADVGPCLAALRVQVISLFG